MERRKKTDRASDAMWKEFYAPRLPEPNPWPVYAQYGITPHTLLQLNKRGIIVGGLGANNEPLLAYAAGSPGAVFNATVNLNTELPQEERERLWWRFYNDALSDQDDDHFRAQWPELFTHET